MKRIVLLLLVLSTLIVGCAQKQVTPVTPTSPETAPAAVSENEALNEVDNSVIAEDSDVEIGEMI